MNEKTSTKQYSIIQGVMIICGATVVIVIMLYLFAPSSFKTYTPPPQTAKPTKKTAPQYDKKLITPSQKKLDTFMITLEIVDRHLVVESLKYDPLGNLTVTVNERWDALSYEKQLDYAKTFLGAWASQFLQIGGPTVNVKIVDKKGNTVLK